MDTSRLSSLDMTTLAKGPRASARTQNLRAVVAMALVVLGFLLFWPTTASLIEQWEDTVRRTYTHGFLIVAITLWLLWRDRASWSQVDIRPSVLACVTVVGASSLHWRHSFGPPSQEGGAITTCGGRGRGTLPRRTRGRAEDSTPQDAASAIARISRPFTSDVEVRSAR